MGQAVETNPAQNSVEDESDLGLYTKCEVVVAVVEAVLVNVGQ